MNAYLTWEIELVHQIERDDTVAFGYGKPLPRRGRGRGREAPRVRVIGSARCYG